MKLDPLVVDSIKDRVVRSVWALGPLATKAALGRAVECASSILAIAIDALHRDGYIYIGEAGHYMLTDELAATMPKATSVAVAAERNDSNRSESADMSQKQKFCPACEETRDLSKFDKGAWRCKPCVANNVPVKKGGAPAAKKSGKAPPQQSAQKKARAPRAVVAEPPSGNELVIPASGAVTCRISGETAEIRQFDDLICCSLEQLQILRDWASGVLKKSAAAK